MSDKRPILKKTSKLADDDVNYNRNENNTNLFTSPYE